LSSKQGTIHEGSETLFEKVNRRTDRPLSTSVFSDFSKYKSVLALMFSCVIILSVVDLLTTSIALKQGLSEGNVMLLGIASLMKLGFFQTIIAIKIAFIFGAGSLVFLGLRSSLQMTRKIILSSMLGFVLMLLFVSLNNLILILN
jgi:hypothetical protein